jgi:hypothetical protein
VTQLFRLLVVHILPAALAANLYRLSSSEPGWPPLLAALAFWWALRRLSLRALFTFLSRQPPGPLSTLEPSVRFLSRLLAFDLSSLLSLWLLYEKTAAAWGRPAGALVCAGAGWGLYRFGTALFVIENPHHRGRRMLSHRDAKKRAARCREGGPGGLPWGGIVLPPSATSHFAVIGATGSGKTITLRLLMQRVLVGVEPGSGRRAIVYDAKQDTLGLLAGMGLRCPIHILHPLDSRGVGWDIARDCTSPTTALQMATSFIPVEEGANRFFSDAARDLFAAVLVALMKAAPGRWTLRDVVLVMKQPLHLRALLGSRPETMDRLHYFDEPRVFQNIYSTLAATMAWYEPIAAAWSTAGNRISLEGWLQEESVLVLPNDEAVRTPLEVLNRVLFKRFTELALGQQEAEGPRTWVFLDEVREAGKLDGLGRLLTKGRSKGVVVVLGFQDIEGLRAVYGDKEANELVGQCANKAILRLESPETAAWASQLFGEWEGYERTRGESVGLTTGPTTTTNDQVVRRSAVLPSQLLGLPRCAPECGLSGYYLSSSIGAYSGVIRWRTLGRQLRSPKANVPGICPRLVEDQYLVGWDEADLMRLGLAVTSPSPPDVEAAEAWPPSTPPADPFRPRLLVVPSRSRDPP